MNTTELSTTLARLAHDYFERVAGPLTLAYLFTVPLAVTSFTSITPEYLQTWRGMASIVFGPPILWNCLVVYAFIVSDLLRDSDVGLYNARFE